MYGSKITSALSTVNQVRTCVHELTVPVKQYGIYLLIVGHITKGRQIAGPKTLEHMVDIVLYFEGENSNQYRILHTIKIDLALQMKWYFEMSEAGLLPIENLSSLFLAGNTDDREVVDSAVFVGIEDSRPILMEVQVFNSGINMENPRRAVIG